MPLNRRLLTEQRAADTYRTDAQVKAAIDAFAATDLPPLMAAALPLRAVLPTGAALTGGGVDVLQLDGLTPGLWRVEVEGVALTGGSGNLQGQLTPAGGLVAAATGASGLASGYLVRHGNNTSATAGGWYAESWQAAGTTWYSLRDAAVGGQSPFRLVLPLRVTTGGALKFRAGGSAASPALAPGLQFTALKIA